MALGMQWLIAIALGYLLGSIPTALWITYWLTGRDVRKLGDGNAGARNVNHVLGWWPSILVASIDVAKGVVAVYLARFLGVGELGVYAAGAAAVLGHDFPIFARFRGGQGLATITGVNLMLQPLETAIGLLIFGGLWLMTRRFDLSAAFGYGAIPLTALLRGQPAHLVLYPVVLLPTVGLKKWMDRGRVTHQEETPWNPDVNG